MKPEKMREMSVPEIEQMLRDLEQERFNLEFRLSTQNAENPLRVRAVRRDIARARTILREHEKGIRKLGQAEG
ncbi:MAG: 50S ribosomal protein L29 [Candidatus Eisenbacteria sp.]|nr:50S ribosomal protein L29 [Candidatus Eisenbacteria bacterium]